MCGHGEAILDVSVCARNPVILEFVAETCFENKIPSQPFSSYQHLKSTSDRIVLSLVALLFLLVLPALSFNLTLNHCAQG